MSKRTLTDKKSSILENKNVDVSEPHWKTAIRVWGAYRRQDGLYAVIIPNDALFEGI